MREGMVSDARGIPRDHGGVAGIAPLRKLPANPAAPCQNAALTQSKSRRPNHRSSLRPVDDAPQFGADLAPIEFRAQLFAGPRLGSE